MAHADIQFEYTTPVTVGGPSGNYFLDCPIRSCRWAEYTVVNVSSLAAATILISGEFQPTGQLDYTGATTMNDDAFMPAIAINTYTTAPYPARPDIYYRITQSQKRLYFRIDTTNGTAVFVTVRFRIMPISVIPGPAVTAHPDQGHLVNAARSEMTKARLEQMGIPIRVGQEGGTDGGRQS